MKQLFITIGTLILSSILYGQAGGVGINNNGTAPNASAMLDIESTSKGLLVPRVALTNTTDATTITNGNVTSLLIYNTATIADVVPGYYYWDGTVWKTLGGDADTDPNNEIQDLQIVGNNLTITNNGTPTTIDLSPYLDNTDDQNIDSVTLDGTNLTVYIENGTAATVDLSALASDHDWYEVGGTAAPDNINDTIYTMGNVGIGTTTPDTKLHVQASSSLPTDVQHWRNNPGHGSIGGYDLFLRQFDDGYGFFEEINGTGALSVFMQENTGNVGIFTSTPNSKLHIHGGSMGNTIIRDLTIERYGNSQPNRGVGLEFRTGTAGTNSQVSGAIEVSRYDTGQGTKMAFLTTDDGGTENTNMLISDVGNVGIGTITPLTRLEVVENTDFVANFARADNIPGNEVGISLGTNNSNHIDKNAYIKAIEGAGVNVWSLAFGTSNVSSTSIERMRILPNGNIGMGITNPTNKLSIGGNLGTGYGLTVNSGTPYGQVIETTESPATSNPAFWVRTNDGGNISHLLRVQNNGNVGVGTSSPTEKLHVSGSVRIIDGLEGAGKVLTSDANGVASWQPGGGSLPLLQIRKDTDWTFVGDNTYKLINNFDATNYNTTSTTTINLATGTVTIGAGEAGFYLLNFVANIAGEQLESMQVMVNGSGVASYAFTGGSTVVTPYTHFQYLNVGDVVSLAIRDNNSGTTKTGRYAQLTMVRLSL